MARGRMLSKKISRDKRVADLIADVGPWGGIFWTWCIAHLDREGRIDGDPNVLKGLIVPRIEECTVEIITDTLTVANALGIVVWYSNSGDKYLSFPKFEKNQTGMRKDREPESEFPCPLDENSADVATTGSRQVAGRLPEDCRKIDDKWLAEGKGREGKGSIREGKGRGTQALTCGSPPASLEPKKPNHSREIQTVWQKYREHHPACPGTLKQSRKEYKAIKGYLADKEYTVSQLCQAIDGYHLDPYHCGVNPDGTKYLSLELIMRDSGHVLKGIEFAQDPGIGTIISEKERRSFAAGDSWAEKRAKARAEGKTVQDWPS